MADELFQLSNGRYITSEEISRKMGLNGRGYVLENFSWDIIVEKYMNFFEKLESERISK